VRTAASNPASLRKQAIWSIYDNADESQRRLVKRILQLAMILVRTWRVAAAVCHEKTGANTNSPQNANQGNLAMRKDISRILALGLAVLLTVSAVSHSLAQSGVQPARDVEQLVELMASVRTKADAEAQYRELRRATPADARVPYAYAMLLIEQRRYREACDPLKESLRLNGGNLDAWKTRIWLAVLTEEHDDALASMERLVRQMPAEVVSADRERKCREFAGFMGQVFGYLAGPGKDGLDPVKQTSSQQTIIGYLPKGRKAVFEALFTAVLEDYTKKMERIEELSRQAREGEADYRNEQLANLENDRRFAWREMGRLEDLRTHGRTLATNERNVIAATRERSAAGFGRANDTRYRDSQEIGPLYRPDPDDIGWDATAGAFVADPNADWQLDHLADRYQALDRRGRAAGGYYHERGLGDEHYADVSRREEEYHDYLAEREKKMNRRHRRIAQEASRLLRRRITGTTPEVRRQLAEAEALASYVPLPVSPQAEVEQILASYRGLQSPS
jgi:tetratricopeptide (TPR) repeat protein